MRIENSIYIRYILFASFIMSCDDQIEFQLKLHNLEQITIVKCFEINTLDAKLQSIGSIRIQTEDEILKLISEVHKTMKGVQKVVIEIKDACHQLKMNSFYQLFKNICFVLINAIRLLAESCQDGVERNLLKFNTGKKQQIGETLCLKEQIQQSKCQKRSSQQYSEVKAKMQIDRIYETIQAQKQSVMKTFPSNVIAKLNQVKINWVKMINDTDSILQEAYYRKNQGAREDLAEKLHKPQYITKVLKQQLSQSIKTYFTQTVQRALKKLYSQFYLNEYNKIKEQILKLKIPTTEIEVQTEIQGINRIKQIQKQRKNHDKALKQLQESHMRINEMTQQYLSATRNNQLYINRIQQLQRKLISSVPLRNVERMISQSKKKIESRRSSARSSRDSFNISERDKIQQEQLQNKFNLVYGKIVNTSSIRSRKKYQTQTDTNLQIIKKRSKLKRIYSKSRLHTEHSQNDGTQQSQYQQKQKSIDVLIEDQNQETIEQYQNNRNQQTIRRLKKSKNYMKQRLGMNKQALITKKIEQISLKEQEYRSAILQIFKLADKIKKNQQKSVKIIQQKNQYCIQPQQDEKIESGSTKKLKRQSSIHQLIVQKLVQSREVNNIFGDLVKKALSNHILKIDDLKQIKNSANSVKQIEIMARQNSESKTQLQSKNSIKSIRIDKSSKDIAQDPISNGLFTKLLQSQNENNKQNQVRLDNVSKQQVQIKGIPKIKRQSQQILNLNSNSTNKAQKMKANRPSRAKNLLKNIFANRSIQIPETTQLSQHGETHQPSQDKNNRHGHHNFQSDNKKIRCKVENGELNRNMFLTSPGAFGHFNSLKCYRPAQQSQRFQKLEIAQFKNQALKNKIRDSVLNTTLNRNMFTAANEINKNQEKKILDLKEKQNKNNISKSRKLITFQQIKFNENKQNMECPARQGFWPQNKIKHVSKQKITRDIIQICNNYVPSKAHNHININTNKGNKNGNSNGYHEHKGEDLEFAINKYIEMTLCHLLNAKDSKNGRLNYGGGYKKRLDTE